MQDYREFLLELLHNIANKSLIKQNNLIHYVSRSTDRQLYRQFSAYFINCHLKFVGARKIILLDNRCYMLGLWDI